VSNNSSTGTSLETRNFYNDGEVFFFGASDFVLRCVISLGRATKRSMMFCFRKFRFWTNWLEPDDKETWDLRQDYMENQPMLKGHINKQL
jgi:hypothetical protein